MTGAIVPNLAQIALCTNDLPRTIALYSALGFSDAHGEAVCGPLVAQIQGLGTDASMIVWWMTAQRRFTQLELFQHSDPAQRPLPADWRPSDIGWSRWGILVDDVAACRAKVEAKGIFTVAVPGDAAHPRFLFRDPQIGIFVDVRQKDGHGEGQPAIAYAAVSMADMDVAKRFWLDDLDLPEDQAFRTDETVNALMGLPRAQSHSFAVSLNGLRVEIDCYSDPAPRHLGRRLSDQGMMNIGLGFRDRGALEALVGRVAERGYPGTIPLGPPDLLGATYIAGPDGISLELLCVPEEMDHLVGFTPRATPGLFSA